MQVRVMVACMESQADILECTASAQSGRREVTVCFSPMSMMQPHSDTVVLQWKQRIVLGGSKGDFSEPAFCSPLN